MARSRRAVFVARWVSEAAAGAVPAAPQAIAPERRADIGVRVVIKAIAGISYFGRCIQHIVVDDVERDDAYRECKFAGAVIEARDADADCVVA
jgi:hypothetical protein